MERNIVLPATRQAINSICHRNFIMYSGLDPFVNRTTILFQIYGYDFTKLLGFGEVPYNKNFCSLVRMLIHTLKKTINDDLKIGIATKDLKMFKVDIPLGETRDEDVITMLKIDELSIGQEINNIQKIGV
ncbi:hypothetical protein RclHR1_01100033 [Rhizophagus clarus]|uniref:Uncharacterized protein n=1 Tax=Rhizophagus clarus TaxID=94130 RepID=A0A2Z6QI07_9GLOM|nr:hypothetical protein RclHR1_01100033 [Rhizophagus clarus]